MTIQEFEKKDVSEKMIILQKVIKGEIKLQSTKQEFQDLFPGLNLNKQ